MGHFPIHAVATFLVFPLFANAVVKLPGGDVEDASAFVQHSLTGASRVQQVSQPTAAKAAGHHLKALTPEERAKERLRQKRKVEREAKAKGCPAGFYLDKGDVPGPDQFGRERFKTDSIELCAEDCQSKPECTSFEWSPNAHLCNANHEAPQRTGKSSQDFMLCMRNATAGPVSDTSSVATPEVSQPHEDVPEEGEDKDDASEGAEERGSGAPHSSEQQEEEKKSKEEETSTEKRRPKEEEREGLTERGTSAPQLTGQPEEEEKKSKEEETSTEERRPKEREGSTERGTSAPQLTGQPEEAQPKGSLKVDDDDEEGGDATPTQPPRTRVPEEEEEEEEGVHVLKDQPQLPMLPKYSATSLRLSHEVEQLEQGDDGDTEVAEAPEKEEDDKKKQIREEAERKDEEEAARQETEAKQEALREEREWVGKRGEDEASKTKAEHEEMEALCADGYHYISGDVPGWDQFGNTGVQKDDISLCRADCNLNKECMSFEWSPTTKICSLNRDRQPTLDRLDDYIFCQRSQEHVDKVLASEEITKRPEDRLSTEGADSQQEGGEEDDTDEAAGQLKERAPMLREVVATVEPHWQEDAESREQALERAQEAARRKHEAEQGKEASWKAKAEARRSDALSKDLINVEDAASEDAQEAERQAEETKSQEEKAKKQAELDKQARMESEERAARAREEQEKLAKEAEAAKKAEEEREAERKAEDEANRLVAEEEQAKAKAEEDTKQEELIDAIRRAEEHDRQEAEEAKRKEEEKAKQEAEEEAKRIQDLQKKEEEEERLQELEKTNPEEAAKQRRRNELHAKMAAALERKRLAAEKQRKLEEEAGRQQKAIEEEHKRKQAVIEEHQRAMEEGRRRKQQEMQAAEAQRQAAAKAAQEALEREAEERQRKDAVEAARQIQLQEDLMEQKVMAASRPFATPKRTTSTMITLRFQDAHTKTVLLKVPRNMRFKVMMNAACSRLGILLADAQFTHAGRQLDPNGNPEAFGLGDMDLVKVTDFIKVDDFLEREEAKDEDAAAKAAREMFEAAQKEWEGGRKQEAELTQAEKKALEEKAANNTLLWEANTKAAMQSLPPVRSFEDAQRKAREVVKLLDEDEVMGLIFGSSSNQPGYYLGNTLNVSRYDIPALRVHDSTFRFRKFMRGVQKTVTCWPSPLALASTWDDKLVGKVAGAIAKEMRAKGTNVMLGPSVGVIRVAGGGRNFEQLSGEDPYLGSRLASTYVQAVQKVGIMAAVRPFAFYNQETGRKGADVEVSEKVAWELYYPPFEAAVQAGVSAVVCSNVKVNGTGGCENSKLLKTDLKGAMGFKGFVMSEELLGSVAAPLRSGMDSALPGSGERQPQRTTGLRDVGDDEKREAATRVLTSMYQLRMDEMPTWQAAFGLHAQKTDTRTSENTELAYQAAASAITLLKNDGVLPLNPSKVKRLAVLGPAASILPKVVFWSGDYFSGGGPNHVPATNGQDATALDHIMRRAAQHNIQVITGHFNSSGIVAKETALDADVVVVVAATTSSEGTDRTSLALDDNVDDVISTVAAVRPTVVLMQTPGAVVMPWRAEVAAAANLFLAGEATGRAWAAMLFGDISPSGRLPLSMPKTADEQIRPKGDKIRYSEGLRTSYRSNTLGAAFTFGHGLSYTEFSYGQPEIIEKGCLAKVCVRLDIVNTGKRPGAEVVQAYVQFPASESMPRILKGFYKTAVLQPQQKEEAYLVFTSRDISTYHDGSWIEQTDVKVDIGPTSADVRHTTWVNRPMKSLDLDLELS